MSDETPKLHIDSDWKAEAQAEKERLAQKTEERAREREEQSMQLPEADVRGVISAFATPALMSLGTQRDPKTGGVLVDLEGAKFYIDLLAVVEEKTQGNLTDEESKEITGVLHELRSRFVEVTHLVAQAAEAGNVASAGAPDSSIPPAAPGSGPGIIAPD
ncbi:MAG: DUF1844 domain-containing protein [Planctomycetota bacterium]